MSIIFGTLEPEGDLVSDRELSHMAVATERYAPDGLFVRTKGRVGMGCQLYHIRLVLRATGSEASPVM